MNDNKNTVTIKILIEVDGFVDLSASTCFDASKIHEADFSKELSSCISDLQSVILDDAKSFNFGVKFLEL